VVVFAIYPDRQVTESAKVKGKHPEILFIPGEDPERDRRGSSGVQFETRKGQVVRGKFVVNLIRPLVH